MKKAINKWENMGDVNFLEYGGMLVRPTYTDEEINNYPILKGSYDVFYLNTEPDTEKEDVVFAALLDVDIEDYINDENSKLSLLKVIGREREIDNDPLEIMDRTEWAREIVDYYGICNFSPTVLKSNCYYPAEYEDFLCTREECKQWLIELGAGEIIEHKEK